ncbi:30S ribosomal protein S4, partial [Escherichia coli]|uniref:30S ribosomal protein S4 n=1 Tax=Escherichia coli TaxID=562 RepID=UPI003B9CA164
MSRYRGPKMRILKRLGSPLPGFGVRLNQKFQKNRKKEDKYEKRKNQKNPFLRRLKEKQKIRYHYGLTEKNLINYVRKAKARRQKTSTGEMLLKLLEMRLDNILFRYGYAPTLPAARQFITHVHILLNGKTNNRPS